MPGFVVSNDSIVASNDGVNELGVRQHNAFSYSEFNFDIASSISAATFNILTEVESVRTHDVVHNRKFVDGLERLEKDLQLSEEQNNQRYRLVTDGTIGVSLSATAGVLAWVLRGGVLFASAMTYTPLWSSIDPIRVVAGKRDDSETADETDGEVEEYFSD